jgi:2-haloacid dehalogenase
MDFQKFNYLSFDCYGTLVDWERGILDALLPFLGAKGLDLDPEQVLADYAELESAVTNGAYRIYKEVLVNVMQGFAVKYGFELKDGEEGTLLRSLPHWPVFPDTVASLHLLSAKYKLVILSNIDSDLIAETAKSLQTHFHEIIPAERIGSYKPALRNFEFALAHLGADKSEVCHVAQSLYHDIAPAKTIGLKTIWVNRRKGKEGTGATPASTAVPDLEFGSLAEMAEAIMK